MKILLWDCETSPLITYSWQIYEADAIKVIKDTQMLCFAYKWLGDKKVHVIGQDDLPGYKPGINNDKNLIRFLRGLFDEADVVIAHNGNAFDQKVAQARMIAHDFDPPSPYRQLDTKLIAKRYGRFTSNKLDDLGKTLNLGQKLDTGGFALWEGCLAGDKKSWKKMKKYNIQDVALLEQVYLRFRPWIESHPPLNVMLNRPDACPKCGEGPLIKQGVRKYNRTSYAQRYQCASCGGWSQERKNNKTEVQYV